MAQKKTTKNPESDANSVSADDLRAAIERAESSLTQAKEHRNRGAAELKAAIDDYSLNRKALQFVRDLRKLEPLQQQSTLRAVVEYAAKLGLFRQADMFDDLTKFIQPTEASSDPVKDKILNG